MARRSVMTLFSAPADPWSHRTRLVLAEKGIAIELIDPLPPCVLARKLNEGGQFGGKTQQVPRHMENGHFILFENRTRYDILNENRTQCK